MSTKVELSTAHTSNGACFLGNFREFPLEEVCPFAFRNAFDEPHLCGHAQACENMDPETRRCLGLMSGFKAKEED